MTGGAGNDTYVVDAAGDTVIEAASAGTDTVQASVSYTLSANVENLTLIGSDAINGTGNELNNVITGNDSDNILTGGAGNDSISAGAGNDTLDGGTGDDSLIGGTGNDSYIIDSAADVITEAVGAGTDSVQSSLTYTLGANLENLTLTGADAIDGTGNELNNVIIGNSANNTLTGNAGEDRLDGGLGADSMLGGSGNDSYVVNDAGDIVTEVSIFGGTDTVESSITYTLGANLENLTLTGTDAIAGYGNALDNTIIGNDANNVLLYGDDGDDSIFGRGGDDELRGNSGNDTLHGDAGNDYVRGGRNNDSVFGDDGNDTLLGVNSLDGSAGVGEKDILTGGAGNDTFVLGSATEVYYDDGVSNPGYSGNGDYARITDFVDGQDSIQLKDISSWIFSDSYTIENRTIDGVSGAAIYVTPFTFGTPRHELVGLVQGVDASALSFGTASGGTVTLS